MLITGVDWQMQIVYAILFLPAILASYYNLKHLIIPDVEDGILAAIRMYNLLVLVMTVLIMVSFTLKMSGQTVAYSVVNVLAGLCAPIVLWLAKQGTERWLR